MTGRVAARGVALAGLSLVGLALVGLALVVPAPMGLAPMGLAPAAHAMAAPAPVPDAPHAARPASVQSVEQVRYHMGTLWTVQARGPEAAAAMEAAFAEIGRLDRLLSTYRTDSELSRLNREGGKGWVAVSAETRMLVERSLAFSRASGGAFDPTVGPLVKIWGFKHLDYRIPAEAEIAEARQRVGFTEVQVDARRGIRFRRPGVELDLGAIAKGYAVDRAVQILKARGMRTARVDAGGNQRVWGEAPEGDAPEGDSWIFGVRHPRLEGEVLGWTSLRTGSVSTSGDAERGFWKDGVRYGHVIDPRTGQPVQGTVSVTVLAPDAETADALSTTLYVLGPEAGSRVLAAYPGAEALWVTTGSQPGTFVTRPSAGFPWIPGDR
jgi:thiamine biosynthesis lipoprotein